MLETNTNTTYTFRCDNCNAICDGTAFLRRYRTESDYDRAHFCNTACKVKLLAIRAAESISTWTNHANLSMDELQLLHWEFASSLMQSKLTANVHIAKLNAALVS